MQDPDAASAAPAAEGEAALAPGQQIAGRYRIIRLLGRGASAAVVLVHDLVAHEDVAVKLFSPGFGIERLREEVRAARRVTHRNVVRVFDIAPHGAGALLSMEYVAGGTLAERLGRPHGDDEARRMLAPLLDGLEAAHRAGVVHRDLKPANVLVGADGRVVLTDFGVARPQGPIVDTGETGLVGTPAYMAPEQLTAGATDARTDLYALGLIAHELVAGHLPFVAPGQAPTLAHALRRLQDDLPPLAGSALAPAVARLCARRPEDRPASVAEARRWLGLDAVAVPAGTPRRPARPRALVAAGGVALAAAVAAGVAWRSGRDVPPPAAATPPGAGAATAAPAARPRLRQLTSGGELLAGGPVFSPDGRALIAASARDDRFQLWWIEAAGAEARPLTDGSRDVRSPHLAGDRLCFERARGDGAWDLVCAEVAALARAGGADGAGVVRERVSLARAAPGGRLALVTPDGLGARVALVAPGGPEREVHAGQYPVVAAAWDPRGERLAFVELRKLPAETGAVWVVDARGGAPRRVAGDVLAWPGLAWQPGGDELVLVRPTGADERALVAVDVASGRERVVAAGLRRATWPTVGPDGRIALAVDQVDTDLWMLRAGDDRLRRLTSLGEATAASPAWVAGGSELAYVVQRADGTIEARRVGVDGTSEPSARRTIDAGSVYVAFTPDGRHVAYERRDDAGWTVAIAALDDDSPPRTLARAAPGAALSVNDVTADGERVTYVEIAAGGDPAVWDVPVAGGAPRRLAERGVGGFRSRDGRWLSLGVGPGGILLQPLGPDGLPRGAARTLPGTGEAMVFRFGPGAGELTVADRRELYVVDIARGTRRVLATLPRGVAEPDRLSVLPDGRVALMLSLGGHALALLEGPSASPVE
jgi:Tol biopolymer transport system component